jgi:hypothetical protein
MRFRVAPCCRTYAEPGGFAIFARGSEVESDQRSRRLAAELLPNLAGLGAPDSWGGRWGGVWRHCLNRFPAHAEDGKNRTANRIKSGLALCPLGQPSTQR